MADKEDIIELIKKCLALTGSPNEHEAQAAMEKAQELLERHNLTMGEVVTTEGPGEPIVIQSNYDILGRFTWRKYLVYYTGRNNFCRVIFSGHRDVVIIVGRPVNVAAVKEMVSWILPQVERLGRQATRQYEIGVDGWESKQRYRNSFLWGCIQRINNRLYQAREERIEASPDTKALVEVRDTEVSEYVNDHFSHLRAHHAQDAQSYKGYHDGLDAGSKVSLYGSSRQVKGGHLRLSEGKSNA